MMRRAAMIAAHSWLGAEESAKLCVAACDGCTLKTDRHLCAHNASAECVSKRLDVVTEARMLGVDAGAYAAALAALGVPTDTIPCPRHEEETCADPTTP